MYALQLTGKTRRAAICQSIFSELDLHGSPSPVCQPGRAHAKGKSLPSVPSASWLCSERSFPPARRNVLTL